MFCVCFYMSLVCFLVCLERSSTVILRVGSAGHFRSCFSIVAGGFDKVLHSLQMGWVMLIMLFGFCMWS